MFNIHEALATNNFTDPQGRPSKNIPKAILAQFIIGFITAFAYLVALFYSIYDLPGILDSPYLFPLASIYHQATNSAAGTLGLLIIALLPNFIGCLGTYLTASRVFLDACEG